MIADSKKVQNDPPQEKIKFILELFNSSKIIDAKKEIEKQTIIYPNSSILFNILGAISIIGLCFTIPFSYIFYCQYYRLLTN